MNKQKKYIGVDIGGTSAKLGIVDEEGNIEKSEKYAVDFDNYETPILKTVIKSIKHFLQTNSFSAQDFAGIGVSATGGIDSVSGVVAGSAGHIRNWDGSQIVKEMEQEFQIPVVTLNDANAAALGEMWKGAAKGRKNAVVMTIGTGVGGGIIVNSQILLGATGFAGEIGHMIIKNDGERCSCGNTGCLERYGSTTALVKRVELAVASGSVKGFQNQKINGETIFAEACNGNVQVNEILDSWMDDIASGIISLVHIFNPEIVLIGGGVSSQKQLFIDKLREKVKMGCMPRFVQNFELEAAELGNDAGLMGAVYYCMQQGKDAVE